MSDEDFSIEPDAERRWIITVVCLSLAAVTMPLMASLIQL